MKPLINRAGMEWSPSTAATLEFCPRQFWFEKIGAWNGWPGSKGLFGEGGKEGSKVAYLLKQLLAPRAWVGKLVHSTIEEFLKRYQANPVEILPLLTPKHMLAYARKRFETEWEASLNLNADSFLRDPKRHPRLDPHFYGIECDPVPLWATVATCIQNFAAQKLPELLQTSPSDWLDIEAVDQDGAPPSFLFEVENVPVRIYSVVDFSLRCHEGYLIVDWKTGRRDSLKAESHKLQLGTYVLYAKARWQAVPEEILVETAYLAEPHPHLRFHRRPGAEIEMHALKQNITKRILEMWSFFDDPRSCLAQKANFTPRPSQAKCLHCAYRGICEAAPRACRTLGRIEVHW